MPKAGETFAHFKCDRCHRPIGPAGRVRLGETFAHFKCDRCHRPIGPAGRVRLGYVLGSKRAPAVKEALCAECKS